LTRRSLVSTAILVYLELNDVDVRDRDAVLLAIAAYPGDPEDRKRLLVDWCKVVGAALTEEMVRAVRGHPQEV
jgi:hypothetical protein